MSLVFSVFIVGNVMAHGVRDHTRNNQASIIHQSQALDIMLTTVTTEPHVLQTWLRTSAAIDSTRRLLITKACGSNASKIKIGQRVRVFPPSSKSSIYQSHITSLATVDGCVEARVQLTRKAFGHAKYFIVEIIIQHGMYLSIPNEAIIEEDGYQLAYVQNNNGRYLQQIITIGLQGELYTQIIAGLNQGDEVVTFGSFFVDADYKLNQPSQVGEINAHHNH